MANSPGTIADTCFLDSGNDAIDTSGSVIQMRNIVIIGAGDKGVSAGECSRLTVNKIRIEDVEIGVASKDDSVIELKKVVFQEVRLGFAVYNKKPEYGPGLIQASFSETQHGEAPTMLLEPGSTLILDGEVQTPNQKGFLKLMDF